MGGLPGLLYAGCRMGLDGLHSDLVEFLDEEVTVLCVHDRLDRGAKHLHIVLVQNALLVQFNTAV